jgi:hypothetical protein
VVLVIRSHGSDLIVILVPKRRGVVGYQRHCQWHSQVVQPINAQWEGLSDGSDQGATGGAPEYVMILAYSNAQAKHACEEMTAFLASSPHCTAVMTVRIHNEHLLAASMSQCLWRGQAYLQLLQVSLTLEPGQQSNTGYPA